MTQKFTQKLFSCLVLTGLLSWSTLGLHGQIIWPDPNNPQEVANSQFDGGLNDWESVGIFNSGPDDTLAIWNWQLDAHANEGNFAGNSLPVMSLSPENGAAVFDSDFNDNNGMPNNFGQGPIPCTRLDGSGTVDGMGHRGELISPVLDFSGQDEVSLRFNQNFRRFTPVNTLIGVSTDGGASWMEIEVNQENGVVPEDDIPVNAGTVSSSVRVIRLTDMVANESNVRIKFIFQGCYYYWVIDDVQFIVTPETNSRVAAGFRDLHYSTPMAQLLGDSVFFVANLFSYGAATEPMTNVALTARIWDTDNMGNPANILFETTEELGDVDARGLDSVLFEEAWVPAMGEIDPGAYFIQYELTSDQIAANNDFNLNDNVLLLPFVVSENTFSFGEDVNTYSRVALPAGATNHGYGGLYRMGETWNNGDYIAGTVDFAAETEDGSAISGNTAQIFLLRLNDGVVMFDEETGWNNNPSIVGGDWNTLVAFAASGNEFTALTEDQTLSVELSSNAGGTDVFLDPGATYLPMVQYEVGQGESTLSHGFNNNDHRYDLYTLDNGRLIGERWIGFSGTGWFSGFTGSSRLNAMTNLNVDFRTSADATLLPETSLSVSPNPATDVLTVNVNLEEASEVQILLTEMSGRIVNELRFDNLLTENVPVDVSQLGAGSYLLHLNTPNGIATEKVMIVK